MFEAKAHRAHLSSSQKIETRIKAEALSKYKHLSPTFTFDVPHFEYILLYKKDSLIFPYTHLGPSNGAQGQFGWVGGGEKGSSSQAK